ncbi:PAS domain S-box protein [Tissierella creatinini]|nr:PAS domain S-box protein [Tissierella creatinini]TJX59999.1 PAS domain S-box protein [Soehngenia saccharolytica]
MDKFNSYEQCNNYYQTILDNISGGMQIAQMIYNDQGEPIDYMFLDVNSVFAEIMGLHREEIIGKKVLDFFPDTEPEWFIKYGEILKRNKSETFEMFNVSTGCWYNVLSVPLGENKFAIVGTDVTESKEMEEKLHNSVERNDFLLKLSDILRPIVDPFEIHARVTSIVKDYLGSDRCYYCEIEDDSAIIRQDAASGDLPSVVGEYPLSSLPIHMDLVNSGKPFMVTDVKTTDIVDEELRQLCILMKVISYLDVPVIKNGKAVGILCIVQSVPRNWTDSEAELAVEIAERIWAAVERAKAEEALRESEEKYRTIFETAQEGIWVIDGNNQTVLVNEKLQEMLGYSFDEMVGQLPHMYMALEFLDLANERLAEVMKGKKQLLDYRFIKKDGSDLWCILSSTPLFDKNGKYDGSVAMITDITNRKKIETEKDHYMKIAEEKANWLQSIMDLVPVGIWISDHNGKVIMVNQEAVNMYRGSSPLSGSLEEYTSYKLFLPGTNEPVAFEQYVPKEALIGVVLDFERFDGTMGTLVASTELLRNKDGDIINYMATAIDITPLRRTEMALRESEKKANMLVAELEKADKNKNEFISVLSHELRNPLAAVTMGLDMLKMTEDGGEHSKKVLDMIRRQIEQLSRLIDDLLEVTRINQGKIELKKELVDLNLLTNNVLKDYQAQYEAKGIEIETALCLEPIFIEADPTRLNQIIGNLLHNAVKFTPNGGKIRVVIDKDEEKHQAIISIQDNGEGILPEFLPDLFKSFSQADKTLDRSRGGLGLGLAIVSGIVELHGGSVEAFSEGLGKGTKFTVRLPIVEKEIEENPSCGNMEDLLNKSLKILVIEDNKDLAQITCELLVFLGHKAIATHTGSEGILKSRELRPDVIISDIGLPDMSGYEVGMEIRKLAELKDIIMIAMSGYAQPEDIRRSKEAGFDIHLGKPVGIDTLKMTLDKFFQ